MAPIGSANWSGGFAAAQHLTQLGHRRIGMISGPEDMLCSVARVDGYRSALERAGIAFNPELVRVGLPCRGRPRRRGAADLPEPPTAIFAGSDLQACGVYEAARLLGRRVPDDLSVVGYDDLRLARWVGPPLTTIRQPLTEMAETAARMLIRMNDDPDARQSALRSGHQPGGAGVDGSAVCVGISLPAAGRPAGGRVPAGSSVRSRPRPRRP